MKVYLSRSAAAFLGVSLRQLYRYADELGIASQRGKAHIFSDTQVAAMKALQSRGRRPRRKRAELAA